MSFFCFLWLPLFYLFWRSIAQNAAVAGGVWALILGSVVALIQLLVGNLIDPGGFGISRWASACIDIVALPALAPLIVCTLFGAFKVISGDIDFASFSLLWLIPGAGIRAIVWSPLSDPVHLVLVPVLWTAIALGIPFFINLIMNSRRWVIAPASLGILAVPFAAASSYWAFYSQNATAGILFGLAAAAPMAVSAVLAFVKK